MSSGIIHINDPNNTKFLHTMTLMYNEWCNYYNTHLAGTDTMLKNTPYTPVSDIELSAKDFYMLVYDSVPYAIFTMFNGPNIVNIGNFIISPYVEWQDIINILLIEIQYICDDTYLHIFINKYMKQQEGLHSILRMITIYFNEIEMSYIILLKKCIETKHSSMVNITVYNTPHRTLYSTKAYIGFSYQQVSEKKEQYTAHVLFNMPIIVSSNISKDYHTIQIDMYDAFLKSEKFKKLDFSFIEIKSYDNTKLYGYILDGFIDRQVKDIKPARGIVIQPLAFKTHIGNGNVSYKDIKDNPSTELLESIKHDLCEYDNDLTPVEYIGNLMGILCIDDCKFIKSIKIKQLFKQHYIYLIHRFKHNGMNIYKVGKTTERKFRPTRRLNEAYPEGYEIYCLVQVPNGHIAERAIIDAFKKQFGKPVEGLEYFRGDIRIMVEMLLKIVLSYIK